MESPSVVSRTTSSGNFPLRASASLGSFPSELLLICRGRIFILSRRPNSSLASFGLEVGGAYKLLVIRRPGKHVWLASHPMSSAPPFPPRPSPCAPQADVKHELRDLLRIPNLCLSLHRADGEPLPDGASLRDLGMRDGERGAGGRGGGLGRGAARRQGGGGGGGDVTAELLAQRAVSVARGSHCPGGRAWSWPAPSGRPAGRRPGLPGQNLRPTLALRFKRLWSEPSLARLSCRSLT
jgi:hypothetical protein